jgi:hypothetical protein
MTKPQALGEGKRTGVAAANVTRQLQGIEKSDVTRYARIGTLLVRVMRGDEAAVNEVIELCENGVQDNITAFSVLKSLSVNAMPDAEDELMDYNAEKKASAR